MGALLAQEMEPCTGMMHFWHNSQNEKHYTRVINKMVFGNFILSVPNTKG